MTQSGLWSQVALDRVADNLRAGVIKPEATLVHDTTHYYAYSSMQVIDLPEPAAATGEKVDESAAEFTTPQTAPPESGHDGRSKCGHQAEHAGPPAPGSPPVAAGKNTPLADSAKSSTTLEKPRKTGPSKKKRNKKRKSHPRTTKPCRCPDRENCPHPWINADDGAGTVVKSTGRMYWGHKASTLSFADQEVLLDAVAMSDAASHDSQSLLPHLSRLFQRHPDLREYVTRLLDDGAADDPKLKARIKKDFGIDVLASINPRRRGAIRDDLPRGMDHLTPRGVPVCRAGYPFELLGVRHDTEHFLFRAPQDAEGEFVCQGCVLREECYRGDAGGRQVAIPQQRLPWLDPQFPQLSKRFQKAMARRTSIERLHKLMKFDFGDDRLTKRGNASFQARLDKTLFAMHVLLAHNT